MAKKTKTAPTGAKCTSAISGGMFRCQLQGDHSIHSSAVPGRKGGQYAQWSLVDGHIHVVSFSSGKKMSEWDEDAPVEINTSRGGEGLREVGYCAVKFESFGRKDDICVLGIGHEGPHENTSIGSREIEPDDEDGDDPLEEEVRSDADRDLARKMREEREAHARELEQAEPAEPSLTDLCPKCSKELGEHDGKKCPKPAKAKVSKIYTAAEREAIERKEAAAAAAPAPSAPLTKIGKYEVHPAAAIFPMIREDKYEEFRNGIRENGQLHKIVRVLVAGRWLILDGRNRLRALLDLGIEPQFRDFGSEDTDGDDPIRFVKSVNIDRRHMDATDLAYAGAELVPLFEAQAKERQRAAGGAKPLSANLRGAITEKASEAAAKAVGVSPRSVEAALKVKRDAAPEVLQASRADGRLKVNSAADLASLPKDKQREILKQAGNGEIRAGKIASLVRQEKKRDIVRKINEGRVAPLPEGPFGVIYGDYPWKFDNSDQHEGSRGHMSYPPMELDEILEHARDVAKRAAKDCVIALWVTNCHVLTHMPQVIAAYGATPHTMVTWPKHKPGVGSWPRGQTEHLIIASIGKPTHTLNAITTLLDPYKPEHPGEHSSKPAEVRDLLLEHCAGPHLELFAREEHENWECWGAETSKFATEAA